MAPFKLRFSKMSKSRSKESNSNSNESDDTIQQAPQMRSGGSEISRNTDIEVFGNSSDFRTNPSHSPPPSYEHVLDEKRLRETTSQHQNTNNAEHQDDKEVNINILMNDPRISDGTKPEESCLVMRGGKLTINGPEILHKSSKELYRAVAKQCGITCKMNDHCRCIDCQSHYFDCDYDKDEHGKTDGGLGAGTPMFISEAVMHGTACVLL